MLPRSLRLKTIKLPQVNFPDLSHWLPGRKRTTPEDGDGPLGLPGAVPLGSPRSGWGWGFLAGGVGLLLLGTAYQLGRSGRSPETAINAEAPAAEIAASGETGSAPGANPANAETTTLLQSIPQFSPQGLPPIPTTPSVAVPSGPADPAADRVAQRLAEAPRGRENPFAGFVIDPANIKVNTVPVSAVTPETTASGSAAPASAPVTNPAIAQLPPVATQPIAPQPLPQQPIALQPLPQQSIPQPPAPIAVPQTLAAPESPTALAEQLEIKGLLQIGGQLKLIIKEEGATSTRTVQVGDRVSGGRVLIRKIEVPDSGNPQVTLEQNGKTIVRTVS
ncbi:MAG: hypothetical protein ACO35Q_02335 [Prochlorothrix sp.]